MTDEESASFHHASSCFDITVAEASWLTLAISTPASKFVALAEIAAPVKFADPAHIANSLLRSSVIATILAWNGGRNSDLCASLPPPQCRCTTELSTAHSARRAAGSVTP